MTKVLTLQEEIDRYKMEKNKADCDRDKAVRELLRTARMATDSPVIRHPSYLNMLDDAIVTVRAFYPEEES